MLTKKEKKSYGAFIDCFLDDCKVVSDFNYVTHIHLTKTNEFPAGIYMWEPRTGVLQDLDHQHVGILPHKRVVKVLMDRGGIVLLKHKSSWEEMVDEGTIKSDDKEKLDWEWDLGNPKSGPTPTESKPKEKKSPGGFLKKLLGK